MPTLSYIQNKSHLKIKVTYWISWKMKLLILTTTSR